MKPHRWALPLLTGSLTLLEPYQGRSPSGYNLTFTSGRNEGTSSPDEGFGRAPSVRFNTIVVSTVVVSSTKSDLIPDTIGHNVLDIGLPLILSPPRTAYGA